MTPHYLFDGEVVRMAFVLGIVFSMALYEWRQLTTGSIVVPGYLGIFILQPSVIVASLANAAVSYWLVHRVLPRLVSMSARTKFSALVLTSVAIQSLAHTLAGVVRSDSASASILVGAGYVIPALIGHDMARQGAFRSLSAVLGTSLATGLCVVGLAWLTPDVALARTVVAPLQCAFLLDGMFVAMLLSAVSVVALQSWHRLGAGGFVGPAYLSLIVVHPLQLVFLAVLTPLTYLTTMWLLKPRMILFGRRKFAAMLLIGCLYSWGGMRLLEAGFGWHFLPFSSPLLSVVSVVLIGLLANDADRVGWPRLIRGGALALLFTLPGTLLVLEVSDQQRIEVLLPLTVLAGVAGVVIFAPLVNSSLGGLFAPGALGAQSALDSQAVPASLSATMMPPRRSIRWYPVVHASTAVCLVLLMSIAFLRIAPEAPLFLSSRAGDRPDINAGHATTRARNLAKFAAPAELAERPGDNRDWVPAGFPSLSTSINRSKNHDYN